MVDGNNNVIQCPRCGYPILRRDISKFSNKCPNCGYCVGCDFV